MLGTWWTLRVEWINAISYTFHSTIRAWLKRWGKTASFCLQRTLMYTLESPGEILFSAPLVLFNFNSTSLCLFLLVAFPSSTFWFYQTFIVLYFLIMYLIYILFNLYLLSNYYERASHLQFHFNPDRITENSRSQQLHVMFHELL